MIELLVICIIRSYCMSALRPLLSKKMKILKDISIKTIKNSISHLEWFAYRINQQYINYFKESSGMGHFVNIRDDYHKSLSIFFSRRVFVWLI